LRRLHTFAVLFVFFFAISLGFTGAQEVKGAPTTVAVAGSTSTLASATALPPDSTALHDPIKIEYGFDHRVRTEMFDNYLDMNGEGMDTRRHLRFRTRAWTNVTFGDNVTFSIRLANEFRKITTAAPGTVTTFRQTAPDETFIDNLYVDVKKLFVPGLSLRIGRQDLMRGEGFLIAEGSPLEGSRSFYFNAVSLAYQYRNSTVEVLGILQPGRDRLLPKFNDRTARLSEADESMVGLYYTGKKIAGNDIETYFLHKKQYHDSRSPTSPIFLPDRHVETAGARVSRTLAKDVTAAGEFAYQWGRQRANTVTGAPEASISAFGGYGWVQKSFSGKRWQPYLRAGYYLTSGDDPGTRDKHEGWDPLFGRYPARAEITLYSLGRERGIGYFSNWQGLQIIAGAQPHRKLKTSATWIHMNASHPFTNGSASTFGTGTHRGDMLEGKLEYTVNESTKGHVMYQSFSPGSYYAGKDRAYFLRAEIMYTFKGILGARSVR